MESIGDTLKSINCQVRNKYLEFVSSKFCYRDVQTTKLETYEVYILFSSSVGRPAAQERFAIEKIVITIPKRRNTRPQRVTRTWLSQEEVVKEITEEPFAFSERNE